ncbi:MAG: NADH:flavin oxidoreductase/NADH oxidase [Frankiales bacterium]|nr:NADH:flavin oxidoreductase/NADH oxidase [Frankiales bacterium]
MLTEPLPLGTRTAPSRVVFGPHETNLGRDRALSDRHVAYYRERARGGSGVIVVETASVHDSDWPYERAPLASDCGPGWTAIATECAPALVLASLGHTGGQGSSAYSQQALWAPSPVADAVSRELPMVMDDVEIAALTAGFGAAARLAVESGCAGVEIEAGDRSVLRQFLSGITNQRGDDYGSDRARLLCEVIAAVREAVGDGIVALRLSCDELAPWAGVTPAHALALVRDLPVDLLTVVRAGPYAGSAYRPDAHAPEGFNRDLCASIKAVAPCPVVLQGSVVSAAFASAALADGVCDLVEMTRAQIADPALVGTLRLGGSPRPCVLCNQACRVRDARNPIVSCIGEPRSGYETRDPEVPQHQGAADVGAVLVVGGGPAGLECARVLALQGFSVEIRDSSSELGGALREAALGAGRSRLTDLVDWLAAECARLGVKVSLGHAVDAEEIAAFPGAVVLASGSCPGSERIDARAALRGELPADGPVLVHDPIGGPIGVSVAEKLAADGRDVRIVTQDPVVGTLLSMTGDLADCNTRLQQAGVTRELKSLLRKQTGDQALLEDVWTGSQRWVPAGVVVDCGPLLPQEDLYTTGMLRAGDCVAPRTVLEAVLEGRRVALELAR